MEEPMKNIQWVVVFQLGGLIIETAPLCETATQAVQDAHESMLNDIIPNWDVMPPGILRETADQHLKIIGVFPAPLGYEV
jgi:hypothetical protein